MRMISKVVASIVGFFLAKGEHRVFVFYRLTALIAICATLGVGFSVSASLGTNYRMGAVAFFTVALVFIEIAMLLAAEIQYEDTHGLRPMRISDGEELD